MWRYINYKNNLFLIPPSPSGFSIHWWFLLELLLWWLPNGNFSNSVIPSTFITWHSTLRKSFPLIIYLWISIYFNLLLSLFILILDWLQFGQGSPFEQFLCLFGMSLSFSEPFLTFWHNKMFPASTCTSSASGLEWVTSSRRVVYRNQDLNAGYAHCYCGVATLGPSQWTELESVCVCVCILLHLYLFLSR